MLTMKEVMNTFSKISGENFDAYLVSEIRKHKNLYDKQNRNYNDVKKRQASWEKVAAETNLDVETAQKRWQDLRCQFIEAYNKEFDIGGSQPTQENEFPLFDKMMWLPRYMCKKKRFYYPPVNNGSCPHESKCSTTEAETSIVDIDDDIAVDSKETTCPLDNSLVENSHFDKGDHYFMMSVINELKNFVSKKKMKFKRKVLQLLEECMSDEAE